MPVLAIRWLVCLTAGMRHLFGLVVMLCLSSLAQAVELLGPPQVQIQATTATLTWKTDVACGTRVSYGLATGKADQKAEGPVTALHEVSLTGLKAGATYQYTLGSARQQLHAGRFEVPGSETATAPPAASAPARKSILDKVFGILSPEDKPASKAPATTVQSRAPPTRETWGRMDTLQDHFVRHGPDFQSRSPDEYAAQAWLLLQRGKRGELPMKWDDADGTLRVFDPQTRAFAAYNRQGMTKTFFRPGNPSYWQRQPGREVKASNLPF